MKKLLHFFACPKPFTSEFQDIQSTAIESWIRTIGDPKLIHLIGDEQGVEEFAKEHGCNHIPSVEKNEWGTPLMSSIFSIIQQSSSDDANVNDKTRYCCCYINCDIVIDKRFLATFNAIFLCSTLEDTEWLLVGRRIDHDFDKFKNIDDALSNGTGQLHSADGIDYFVFPSGTFKFVYPFAIGKFAWDQWIVGNAYRRGIPVIDGTKTIPAIHLNGPWLYQGEANTDRGTVFNSEESKRNRNFDYYLKTIATGSTMYTYTALASDGSLQINVLPHELSLLNKSGGIIT
jgi:hypothetical protein